MVAMRIAPVVPQTQLPCCLRTGEDDVLRSAVQSLAPGRLQRTETDLRHRASVRSASPSHL